MKKKVVGISGASGFLGGYLLDRLLEEDYDVFRISHSALLLPNLRAHLEEKKPDYIFHLASYGNLFSHQKYGNSRVYRKLVETKPKNRMIFEGNVENSFRFFEALNEIPYTKLIYTSTSSVLLPNQTLYSTCKRMVETLITNYDKPITILRPATITGVGDQTEHLIPQLILSAEDKIQIPFVASPTHDYIDVNDVVEALMLLMDAPTGIYNAGTNIATSNEEVKRLVEKYAGPTLTDPRESMRSYDNKNWKVDNSALTKLGWTPEYSLEETIKDMVDDFELTA